MGFIVAVFLTYMDEESSFFMLHSLMKKYDMEGFYLPGFPILKKTFYILLNLEKKFIPKIYELFKKEGMIPSMYASEWFICLFSRNLEFNSLVRIFDVFLLEGYKVIYRFALAFLKLKEEKFLEGKDGLASIMPTINECTENVDVEKVFNIAFGFSISRKYIEKLGNEYEKVKNDEKNGIKDDNTIVKATKEFANMFNKYGFSDNIAHKAYDIRKIFKTCDEKFTQLEQTILVDLAPSKAEEAFSLIPSLKQKVSEEVMQQLLDDLNKYVVM